MATAQNLPKNQKGGKTHLIQLSFPEGKAAQRLPLPPGRPAESQFNSCVLTQHSLPGCQAKTEAAALVSILRPILRAHPSLCFLPSPEYGMPSRTQGHGHGLPATFRACPFRALATALGPGRAIVEMVIRLSFSQDPFPPPCLPLSARAVRSSPSPYFTWGEDEGFLAFVSQSLWPGQLSLGTERQTQFLPWLPHVKFS